MNSRRLLDGVTTLDGVVGAGLFVLAMAEVVTTTEYGGGTSRLVVAAALQTLPLAWRRTHVLAVVSLSATGVAIEVAGQQAYGDMAGFLGFVVLVHAVARWGGSRERPLALAVLALGVALHTLSQPAEGPMGLVGNIVFPLVLGSAAWAVGRATRRGEQREIRQRAASSRALELERTRIARELHDVVGHALAGISLTSGAAQLQAGARDPDIATALEIIRTLSRDAAADVGRMVGLMREPAANSRRTTPTVDALPGLVEQMRATGLAAELVTHGQPRPVPAGVGLTLYRVVQEGLTNVARHASGAAASVIVEWAETNVAVTVANAMPSGGYDEDDRGASGFGIIGLRERVQLYDGALHAGVEPDQGFVLRACLPLP